MSDNKYIFHFSSINLWCNKNLVDTQFLMGRILSFWGLNEKYDVEYFADPYSEEVGYIFLNTCGFLSSGRDEMTETLEKLVAAWKKVFVLGCGLQYIKKLDKSAKPPIFDNENVNILSWKDMDKVNVLDLIKGYSSQEFEDFEHSKNVRAYTNSLYGFEYLKVAEWCNNSCSFCIIPKIRWKQKSIGMDNVLKEAKNMIDSWVEEIILLSQDTTRYWVDLYKKPAMFELLEKLEAMEEDFAYRIMYLYPDIVTLKQLEKLASFEKLIPYFDIPLQHIAWNVLERMWRFYNTEYIYKFLEFIKENFETSFIRTNIIVGFPGETDQDFEQLCEFLEKGYFDNIAIFEYHDEPLAPSSKLDQKVEDDVIRSRFLRAKKIVDEQLAKKQEARKWRQEYGYVMDIVADESGDVNNPTLVVRPWLHAPEIDAYDEIKVDAVTWVLDDEWNVDIGSKIVYNV